MIRSGLVALLLLGACDPWDEAEEEDVRVLRRTAAFGPRGRIVLDVPVEPGETAMHATVVVRSGANAWVERLVSPEGEVFRADAWWEARRNKTNAAFAAPVVSFNWPVDADDPPLVPGRWRLVIGAVKAADEAEITVALKADDDLATGTVLAHVVYAGNLASDVALVGGVDRALHRWRYEIYGPAGIEVEVEQYVWDGPDALASPGFGDAEQYEALLRGKNLRAVPVILARWITDGVDVYGVAGGIPGPLAGTDRSAVTISVGEAFGADLKVDEAEVELLSETIAHEVGHYLGLFHPVEIPRRGDRATTFDALDDTPECGRFSGNCLVQLGSNLMFPTPVCARGSAISCDLWLPQVHLSADQQGVMNRYVGVR